jgi:hypothetical protein
VFSAKAYSTAPHDVVKDADITIDEIEPVFGKGE